MYIYICTILFVLGTANAYVKATWKPAILACAVWNSTERAGDRRVAVGEGTHRQECWQSLHETRQCAQLVARNWSSYIEC